MVCNISPVSKAFESRVYINLLGMFYLVFLAQVKVVFMDTFFLQRKCVSLHANIQVLTFKDPQLLVEFTS